MNREEITKKIVSGFAWESGTKLVIQLTTWATTILVARILSPEDYGIVAISGIFTGVLALISDMGFMTALINKKSVSLDEMDQAFWASAMVSVLLLILLYIAAPYIAGFYGIPVLTDILRVSALVLPIGVLKIIPSVIAMREMNFRYRALVDMVGQFVTAAVSVLLAVNGFGVWTLVLSVLAGQAAVVAGYVPLMKRTPRLRVRIHEMQDILSYGSHLMLAQILEFFTLRADVFIIGLFLPHNQLGYYSMGYQLATIPLDKVGALFNRITFPSLSRIKEDVELARSLFIGMHKYLVFVTFPMLAGLMAVADDLIVLLLTDKWAPMTYIIEFLCVLNIVRVSGMIMPYVIAGMGDSGYVFKFHLVSAIALPAGFFVGVQFGMTGVLIAWLVVYPYLYYRILSELARKMQFSLHHFLKSARSSAYSTLLMLAVVYLVRFGLPDEIPRYLRLVSMIIAGGVSYIASFYFLFPSDLVSIRERMRLIRRQKPAQGGAGA